MNKYFSDWIRIYEVTPTEESLAKKWTGIENIVKKMDDKFGLDVVRLFFGKSTRDPDFIDSFRETFKEADPTFRMDNNDLELKVLAGISLITSLEQNLNIGFYIATAILCASFQGAVSISENPPVINIAKRYLKDEAIDIRTIKGSTSIKEYQAKKEQLLTNLEQNNLPAIQEPMKALLDVTQDILDKLRDSLLMRQEESNMLWWVTGEYSNILNKKITEISLPFACLIVAKELEDMTQLLPGPLSIPALMDKMMSIERKENSKLSIKNVVNDASEEWKIDYINKIDLSPVEDLCPLHYAINKSVETGDQTAWIASFEKNIGIKADQQFTPVEIAMQAYNEMLFINYINEK